MKNKLIIYIFLLSLPFSMYSQIYEGKLIDYNSKKPISDVNIYNLSKNNFTFSDENGYFKIKAEPLDSLQFSHIAYNLKYNVLKNLKNEISLTIKSIVLNEILIENISSKSELLNNDSKNKNQELFGISFTGKYAFKLKNKSENKIQIKRILIPVKYKKGYVNEGKFMIQLYNSENNKISNTPLCDVIYIDNIEKKRKYIDINFDKLIIEQLSNFYIVITRTLPSDFKIDKMTKFSLNPFIYFNKDKLTNEAFFFMHNSSSSWKSGNELFQNNYSELLVEIYGNELLD